jgi:hypothetical protein
MVKKSTTKPRKDRRFFESLYLALVRGFAPIEMLEYSIFGENSEAPKNTYILSRL